MLAIAAMATAGCTGNIGDGDGDSDGFVPPDENGFTCDPKLSALTASSIKRLPKTYFESSITELFSTLDPQTRDALIASVQSRLDLIPDDISDHYSINDERVTQDHADAIFGVAVALAAKLADESPAADQLMSVCGDGSTRADLDDDDCLKAFVTHYARKALRRPATPTRSTTSRPSTNRRKARASTGSPC